MRWRNQWGVGLGHNTPPNTNKTKKGLVQTEKKNMERMAEVVPHANEQVLQHFLSNSPWDANAVMTQVAMRSNDALQDGEDRCLLIDETSFLKKGTKKR